MIGHGLTGGVRVYRIPAGTTYLVFEDKHDHQSDDLLQRLKGAAIQVVIDDEGGDEMVFVWPAPAGATSDITAREQVYAEYDIKRKKVAERAGPVFEKLAFASSDPPLVAFADALANIEARIARLERA